MAKANKGVADKVGTSPTVGVQMVEFRRRHVRWVAWDLSGQGDQHSAHRGYYATFSFTTEVAVFVLLYSSTLSLVYYAVHT